MFPAASCNALNLANTNARSPCPQTTLEAHARGGTLFTGGDIIHSDNGHKSGRVTAWKAIMTVVAAGLRGSGR